MSHRVDEALVTAVVTAVMEASRAIMAVYETEFDIQQKADQSPITPADYAAHDVLMRRLDEITPGLPVLSEESPVPDFDVRRTWDTYWLVDPLDGTRGFVNRTGEFSVNVGLVERHRPVLGVVSVPVEGVVYYGRAGGGAFKQRGARERRALGLQAPARVPPVVTCSRSRKSDRIGEFLARVGVEPSSALRRGSCGLKCCLIADGTADVYPSLGPTCEWDTAAAQCLIEEAGGALTDLELRPLRYNTKVSIVNPDFVAFAHSGMDWRSSLPQSE